MTMPQDPKQKASIKAATVEMSNAWMQAKSHNDHAKAIAEKVAEDHDIDKKLINKIARMYHNTVSVNEIREQTDEITDAYEAIFGSQE